MTIQLRKIWFFLFAALILSGCSKVAHLDQLLTLKGLADEQVSMGEQIDRQDQKFEMMVQEIKAGTFDQYPNKKEIVRKFGDPIYTKVVRKNDQQMEVWLYRYAAEFFASEKIYLTFDSDHNLVDSEYIGGSDGEVR